MENIKYTFTVEKEAASQENIAGYEFCGITFKILRNCLRLSSTAFNACAGKRVVLTEQTKVSSEEYKNLSEGGVINIGRTTKREKRDTINCTVEVRFNYVYVHIQHECILENVCIQRFWMLALALRNIFLNSSP